MRSPIAARLALALCFRLRRRCCRLHRLSCRCCYRCRCCCRRRPPRWAGPLLPAAQALLLAGLPTTPGPPRARTAVWPGAAGAAGAPAGGRTVGTAPRCLRTGAAAPARRQCKGRRRERRVAEHWVTPSPGGSHARPSSLCAAPRRRPRCALPLACASEAVATVRCVRWKASTPSSQGRPQCASSVRVVPSCARRSGGGAEVGLAVRVRVGSAAWPMQCVTPPAGRSKAPVLSCSAPGPAPSPRTAHAGRVPAVRYPSGPSAAAPAPTGARCLWGRRGRAVRRCGRRVGKPGAGGGKSCVHCHQPTRRCCTHG